MAPSTTTAGLEGSVYTDVDVPDFAKAPMTLSGVVLMTPRSSGSASRLLQSCRPCRRRRASSGETIR